MSSPTAEGGNGDKGGDGSRQRKFFPRLKALLSEEYEEFLRQIIDIIEANQCAAFPMATADTPWADAFEAIYKTVASEYALPQGKNRLHKFKEKMVELWSAMQSEVTLGVKSDAHPIYRTALRQWKLHQSVMKDKAKPPPPLAGEPDTPGALGGGGGGGGDTSDPEGEDKQPPRKKPRPSDVRKSTGSVGIIPNTPADMNIGVPVEPRIINPTQNLVAVPADMIENWQKSLSRLENMLTASGFLQQNLPSPLYELHRLKTQMSDSEFDGKIRSVYEQEIGRHLTQVTAQCRTTSQPGFLPHLLEGLEILRQSPQSAPMKKSLDYTHKTVLTKYLRLLTKQSEPPLFPGTKQDASSLPGVVPTPMDMSGRSSPAPLGVAALGVHDDDEFKNQAEL